MSNSRYLNDEEIKQDLVDSFHKTAKYLYTGASRECIEEREEFLKKMSRGTKGVVNPLMYVFAVEAEEKDNGDRQTSI